jgi:geranylgeranyl pyrophosphate synthase
VVAETKPEIKDGSTDGLPKRRSRRRKTSHLKKVPDSKSVREAVRARAKEIAATVDRARPMTKDELEAASRGLLAEMSMEEAYLGWTMVILSSAFWETQIETIPHNRRLFLLPHCLKHAEGCPADYDEFGLACKTCGACSIADFRQTAEDLGYKVLVAEGSPVVLKIIVSGHVDAICGVACLNVLEKAIDKILLAGIPCMAVPLLSSDCRNTSVDEDWVDQMVRVPHNEAKQETRTYVHLLRGANNLFEPESLETLVPRIRGGSRLAEQNGKGIAGINPIEATEALAYDFLSKGGKNSRPFITMAVYDAINGSEATLSGGEAIVDAMPDWVKRTAMSIETFHKASLVHDDIQDDDDYRYGDETLHKKFGLSTAINVGDYLIGMGYRLVSRDAANLGPDVAADILDCLADSHQRLCEGQGAELLWRDAHEKWLKPIDALKIYALKTSPAFEAAYYCGLRLTGPVDDETRKQIKTFSRNLGVAFQILNDLKDWKFDADNKKSLGADLLSGRPTVLWALAIEGLKESYRDELFGLVDNEEMHERKKIERAHQLYIEAGVFEKAYRLVDKHQTKAEEIADEVENEELRRLLYYLVDSVLDRTEEVRPTIEFTELTYEEVVPILNASANRLPVIKAK